MYYTKIRTKNDYQLTWEDIIENIEPTFDAENDDSVCSTITRITKNTPDTNFSLVKTIDNLRSFNELSDALVKAQKHSLYNTFKIPKRSGGYRTINAPKDSLMLALRNLKHIFEKDCQALYHTAAYAYVKGRCPVDAVKKHQKFGSNWFLKTDFSDFFGSINPEFTIKMLSQIYPFNMIIEDPEGKKELRKALDLCFLDGGLPQGTPISPLLTNLIMIPIDHRLNQLLVPKAFVYTRYADDITVSAVEKFDYSKVVKLIDYVLKEFDAPFVIKPSKTRFAAKAGPNWNLGVMLNKDNKVTVGHMKKKYFKAALCNFICDQKNGTSWCLEDVQELAGTLAYYHSVEKDYFDYVIRHYNEKFKVDSIALLKSAQKSI